MVSEESYSSTSIVFNDSTKIREGLKILKGAYSRERKKDHFFDGYKIQLLLENAALGEFYVYYFAKTQNGDKVDFIIPQCAIEYEDLNTTRGNGYSSSTFGDWLRENIEPEFRKVQ